MNIKLISIVTLSLIVSIGNAAPKNNTTNNEMPKPEENMKNPLGCRDIGYKFNLNTVTFLPEEIGERNSLYFVYNKNSRPLKLYQMREEESSRSMYLNHQILPHSWAVLSTAEKYLRFICTVDDVKSSYGKIVNCSDHLNICEYVNVKYGLNTRGDYWLVKSNSKGGAVQQVLWYGIIPK